MTAIVSKKNAEFHVGTAHTNVSHGGRDSDFDPRITLLCQLTLEEFIQFGIEDTISHELPPLRDSSGACCSHICGGGRGLQNMSVFPYR